MVEIGRETTVGHGIGPSRLAKKSVVTGQDSPTWWNLGRKQVVPFGEDGPNKLRETWRRLGRKL